MQPEAHAIASTLGSRAAPTIDHPTKTTGPTFILGGQHYRYEGTSAFDIPHAVLEDAVIETCHAADAARLMALPFRRHGLRPSAHLADFLALIDGACGILSHLPPGTERERVAAEARAVFCQGGVH